MISEFSLSKRQKRFHQKRRHIQRQVKIRLDYFGHDDSHDTTQPHRLHKRKAMNCGRPRCMLCGNPRHLWKEKTMQERKVEQDSINDELDKEYNNA